MTLAPLAAKNMGIYAVIWHIKTMVKASFEQRVERRNRLIGLLRSEEFWKTSELREHLGISQRTMMRELAELRVAGYPIESDRRRGGGVRNMVERCIAFVSRENTGIICQHGGLGIKVCILPTRKCPGGQA
jgi:biotin operon repressor